MSHLILKIIANRGLWGCHSPSYTQFFSKINLFLLALATFYSIFYTFLGFSLNYLQCIYIFTGLLLYFYWTILNYYYTITILLLYYIFLFSICKYLLLNYYFLLLNYYYLLLFFYYTFSYPTPTSPINITNKKIDNLDNIINNKQQIIIIIIITKFKII